MPKTETHPKLVDIDQEETSGVDHPAHKQEGWAVLKSEDFEELDVVFKEALLLEKGSAELKEALESNKGLLEDAPDEVKRAANTLYEHLTSMEGGGEEEEEETPKEGGGDEEEAGAKGSERSILLRLAALIQRALGKAPKGEDDEESEAKLSKAEREDAVRDFGFAVLALRKGEDVPDLEDLAQRAIEAIVEEGTE